MKKNIENNFCNSLKGKVQIYTTTYGTGYDVTDMFNRGWITLDGKEVVNFSTPDSFKIFGSDYNSTTMSNLWAVEKTFNERNERRLIEKGEFSKFDLTHCCYEYLNMNITDALNHDSPIINSLAILDERCGKRTLKKYAESKVKTHPLFDFFLELRIEADRNKTTTNTV